jgi:regulator of telomere elongation helicase 1
MDRVIEALKKSENALLESPTGTGKTLSLLCSALSWLKTERERLIGDTSIELPKIIYTSRTHSQLSQCQKELANTAYKPRTVLIASRDHLCVNSAVNMNKGFALNAACRSMQKAINPCLYFKNRDSSQKTLKWDPMDIEDLHKEAKSKCFCPYFAMKDRAAGADVIFMPYNYLIDEKIRENFNFKFDNSIIIFDEAHNIT